MWSLQIKPVGWDEAAGFVFHVSFAAFTLYVAHLVVPGVTPSQLALAWCASRWYVASTIIGATTMEQCKENIDAFDMELSEETLKAMDVVHLEQKDPAMLL